MNASALHPAGEPSPWNVPNALTVLRILMVPLFGWMLLAHPDEAGWRWATTAVFVLAMATDFVDGHIARSRQLITSFGKLMDPIADKALTGMAFIGLSIVGELWWWVTIVILVREWGITVMRFFILKYGVMAANRGGKLKTMTQSAALVLYLMPLPLIVDELSVGSAVDVISWIVMAAAFLLTVLTGLDYVREAFRMRTAYRAAQPAGE
ncbi:CDP-diacylglycerol--glycerol-3-phosphate 3-phosphatidyltransferase [Raineyella antarctica]|uniref:CDP-diacylglycerol--glycerol-3-phosphate 3-phosphatidyltransferase n=1 Tax=Raineyella antarctica TaxID=1577474 RepID=A0A1G6GT86_9ACTN|nr:CDP-diacylglycerol--glycerol-3-phosphate 3-phosphatidyltransferase [Raineyella antarctica]SDB84386.1 CDP-diacylglycerol--glycerol-3-phosphate 3-phosphatidyltransferase [Raineyella antarctica]